MVSVLISLFFFFYLCNNEIQNPLKIYHTHCSITSTPVQHYSSDNQECIFKTQVFFFSCWLPLCPHHRPQLTFFLLLLCPPHLPLWFCSLFSPLFPFLAHHSPPLTLTLMCIVICEQEIVYTLHSTVCACTVHLFACDWGRQLRGRGTQGTGESRGGLLLCWVWLSLG